MILVTGAGGLVGSALVRTGKVTGLTRADLDITDPDAVNEALAHHQPHAVINAAAQAGVDRADEEPDWTMRVNGVAPGDLARSCRERGIRLIHLSTDYVLDAPELERLDETVPSNPQSTYARTKRVGEEAVLAQDGVVVRLQWVYHPGSPGFFTRALQRMAAGETVSLVVDQVGAPTPAAVIAPALLRVANDEQRGLFHLACRGEASAFEWIQRGAEAASIPFRSTPISRSELAGAHRPARSVLDSGRFSECFDWHAPLWSDAVKQVCSEWRTGDGPAPVVID